MQRYSTYTLVYSTMDLFSIFVAWLLYLFSGSSRCQGLLRRKCQVLEKKYFVPFMDLKFKKCDEFEELNFTIAVNCDMVDSVSTALKEIPLDTDWLCLTNCQEVTMEAEVFSQLTNLKFLYITGKAELLPGAFVGLFGVSTLWIKLESNLENFTFYEDTFYGLNSLKELKISGLNFSFINFSIFNHLHQLDHLILYNNSIMHLSKVTTSLGKSSNLPNLRKLSVIFNDIHNLTKDACFISPNFASNRLAERYIDFNITHLDLSLNWVTKIEQNSLCNFPHLELFRYQVSIRNIEDILTSGIKTSKTLVLSSTAYYIFDVCLYTSHFEAEELLVTGSTMSGINISNGSCEKLRKLDLSFHDIGSISLIQFQSFTNLLELNLSLNKLLHFKICASKFSPTMELVYLNVSFNYLSTLQKGQFACLKKLQILSLENNKINHIEDFAFDGLSMLEVMNLQNNNLFIISEFTFANLFSLRHLNLYENRIDEFQEKAFCDLGNLIELRFSYDEWKDIFWWETVLSSLTRLSASSPLVITEEFFSYNFPQLQILELDSPDINLKCPYSQFSNVKELHFRNLLSFAFYCLEKPWNPLLNFTNLEKLYYMADPQDYSDLTLNNSLKHAPLKFLYLQDTEKLIRYGRINVYQLFQGLSHLKVLHLKNSGIENLDSKDIFRDLHELEILIIENQNIQEMNETVFSWMPNLKYIYLIQTTFPCSCKFSGLLSWLESGTRVSINFPNQECQINQKSFNLVSFIHSNCHTDLDLIMFAVTFMFTLLFICTSLFYENIWWYILYLVYTVRCWLNHRYRNEELYEYDVFVSYNAHNELWVTEQLLPNLEQNGPPFFRVCIHNRDFEVGRDIVENIMDSIYNSRWTVCVVSRTYLHSNWCSLEMRMATYRLFAESKDSLILVFLDKISREELQHYHRLTKLLDKKTYLDWPSHEDGQQLFWARLRKVIAKSGGRIPVQELCM